MRWEYQILPSHWVLLWQGRGGLAMPRGAWRMQKARLVKSSHGMKPSCFQTEGSTNLECAAKWSSEYRVAT